MKSCRKRRVTVGKSYQCKHLTWISVFDGDIETRERVTLLPLASFEDFRDDTCDAFRK